MTRADRPQSDLKLTQPWFWTSFSVGACEMTTNFFDFEILHFPNFMVVAFGVSPPKKKAGFLTNSLSAPKAHPPQKRKLYFYCRRAVSDFSNSGHFWVTWCDFGVGHQESLGSHFWVIFILYFVSVELGAHPLHKASIILLSDLQKLPK